MSVILDKMLISARDLPLTLYSNVIDKSTNKEVLAVINFDTETQSGIRAELSKDNRELNRFIAFYNKDYILRITVPKDCNHPYMKHWAKILKQKQLKNMEVIIEE